MRRSELRRLPASARQNHAAAGAFDEKGTAPMLTSGEAARKASKKTSAKFVGAGSLVSTGSQMASQI